MILKIITTNPEKIESALKQVEEHNEKDFKRAGIEFRWLKDSEGIYLAYILTANPFASANFQLFGFLIVKTFKKQLKKVDPDIQITEVKESKDDHKSPNKKVKKE
jgi:hypothetical protein